MKISGKRRRRRRRAETSNLVGSNVCKDSTMYDFNGNLWICKYLYSSSNCNCKNGMKVGFKVLIGWLRRSCATAMKLNWHALNSTFPDANCIVSLQINLHWISNSGLLKVVSDIFKMALKTDKGSPVSPGQCSCTQVWGCNGCCAWLWLELVDRPP